MGDQSAKAESSEAINILVASRDGNEVFFKIRRNTPLSKLMDAYCDRQGVDKQAVRFLYDGKRVQDTSTAESLDMEDQDVIDAHFEQAAITVKVLGVLSQDKAFYLPFDFKIMRNKPLSELMDAFCDQPGLRLGVKSSRARRRRGEICVEVDKQGLVFLYHERRLNGADTPESLGMENQDVINVVLGDDRRRSAEWDLKPMFTTRTEWHLCELEAEQRARCLIFCCEWQQKRYEAYFGSIGSSDAEQAVAEQALPVSLGALPLHVAHPAVAEAAELVVTRQEQLAIEVKAVKTRISSIERERDTFEARLAELETDTRAVERKHTPTLSTSPQDRSDGDQPDAKRSRHIARILGMKDGGLLHAEAQQGSSQEALNLKVASQFGNDVFFKIKPYTPLSKLMDAYCDRQGMDKQSLRFLYDGERVQDASTAGSLGMKDQDVIDVFFLCKLDAELEAEQRARCFIFCCEWQQKRYEADFDSRVGSSAAEQAVAEQALPVSLGALPLRVVQPAIVEAAELVVTRQEQLAIEVKAAKTRIPSIERDRDMFEARVAELKAEKRAVGRKHPSTPSTLAQDRSDGDEPEAKLSRP